ncbi:nitroreductase family protein [Massilia sp. HP4]|uniref:nitroreductase family protein n=1 Tax=Massilia sp. HP4 TaxID=2562316 RepID=UPI0010C11BD6|nr:nitroreductase family protein [Massilia sp. HP4]
MSVAASIQARTSSSSYDINRTLSQSEIGALIGLTTQAPSAFNMQNWKFVAVHSPEAKARLLPLAYGQTKVVEAAVTFIVCGTLDQHLTMPAALAPTRDAGIIDQATYDGWVGAVNDMYAANPVMQRDEAVRSASLAAMTLMLAAQEQGLVSCPMIGFDPAGVAAAFELAATDVPVMLVTVGYTGPSNWPKKPRKPVADVLAFV